MYGEGHVGSVGLVQKVTVDAALVHSPILLPGRRHLLAHEHPSGCLQLSGWVRAGHKAIPSASAVRFSGGSGGLLVEGSAMAVPHDARGRVAAEHVAHQNSVLSGPQHLSGSVLANDGAARWVYMCRGKRMRR